MRYGGRIRDQPKGSYVNVPVFLATSDADISGDPAYTRGFVTQHFDVQRTLHYSGDSGVGHTMFSSFHNPRAPELFEAVADWVAEKLEGRKN